MAYQYCLWILSLWHIYGKPCLCRMLYHAHFLNIHSGKSILTIMGGCCSLGDFDLLPLDLVDSIIGFLDVGTRCTARLVCRGLSRVASISLNTLKLPAEGLRPRRSFLQIHRRSAISFKHFPRATRVIVTRVPTTHGNFQGLAHPNIRDAITELKVMSHRWIELETGLPTVPHWIANCNIGPNRLCFTLPALPNLRSMTVLDYGFPKCLTFPSTLEELILEFCHADPNAHALTRLTKLTSLHMTNIKNPDRLFDAVKTLPALQRLDIECWEDGVLDLTKLAPLQLTHFDVHVDFALDLALIPLFDKLVHLGIMPLQAMPLVQGFRSVSRITTLKSLDISLVGGPPVRGAVLLAGLNGLSLTRLRRRRRITSVQPEEADSTEHQHTD
jgi:hypothetical protein